MSLESGDEPLPPATQRLIDIIASQARELARCEALSEDYKASSKQYKDSSEQYEELYYDSLAYIESYIASSDERRVLLESGRANLDRLHEQEFKS